MPLNLRRHIDERALEQSWLQVRRLARRYPDEWGGEDLLGVDPVQVFGGARVPRRVLVVTSEAALKRWKRSDWPADLAVVVAAGMLSRAQSAIIGRMASDPSTPIAFVGSADPMTLHTYLTLQLHLGAKRVRFCGICDSVLDIIGDDRAQPETLRSRELSAFDLAHLRVVASLVRPEQVLGPRVAAVLGNSRGISIAAIHFRAGMVPALFRAALKLSRAVRPPSLARRM